jgi:hypothetical protein
MAGAATVYHFGLGRIATTLPQFRAPFNNRLAIEEFELASSGSARNQPAT